MKLKVEHFSLLFVFWNYFNSRLSLHWWEEMGAEYRHLDQEVRVIPAELAKGIWMKVIAFLGLALI